MRILLGILVFFLLLILFIRSPWGQNIIVQKVVSYVSDKTNTKVEIGRLYITFSGNIYLEKLYLEDTKGDTLVYSNSLEADIPLWPILRGNGVAVNRIDWNGLKANVYRKDSLSGFNFQFLIDAFASEDIPQDELNKEPLQLKIGKINFTAFDLSFQDEVSGIDTQLLLGELNLRVKKLDFEQMRIHIAELRIENTTAKYLQTLAAHSDDEDEAATAMPFVVVDALHLNSIRLDYHSVPGGIKALADIKNFFIEVPKVDLVNRDIEVNRLALENSKFLIETTTIEPVKEAVEEVAEEVNEIVETQTFSLPDWSIVVGEIALKNNNIGYFADKAQTVAGRFNPSAIDIISLELLADNLSMKDNAIRMNLESLKLQEASGIWIKSLGFDLEFTENELALSNIDIHINDNFMKGDILLDYPSFEDLINTPDMITLNTDLSNLQLDFKDAFLFSPELKKNQYIYQLSKHLVNGNLQLTGSLTHLDIAKLNLLWGSTSITTKGSLKEVLDTQKMTFDFPQLVVRTTRKDALLFVHEEELGISIPDEAILNANFKGKFNDITAQALLKTTDGSVAVEGGFSTAQQLAFQADVSIKDLEIGKILQNNEMDTLDFEMKASGSGKDVNSLDAELEARVERFSFKNYVIRDWEIQGELQDGMGHITSAYKDGNIDIDMQTAIALDSVKSYILADIEVRGINLQAVGLTETDIRSAFKLHADFQGNPDDFVSSVQIKDGLARKENQTYLLGDFDMKARVQKDSTSVDLTNKMIQAKVRANTHPKYFSEALKHHFEHYFTDTLLVHTDSVVNPLKLQLQLKVNEAPILKDVFLTGLERMDSLYVDFDFDQQTEKMTANVRLPHLSYNGNVVDSLAFSLDSDHQALDFDLGFRSIETGLLAIQRTRLGGNLKNNLLSLDLASFHNGERILNINSELAIASDTLRFRLKSEDFILNSLSWEVPEQNSIVYTNKKLEFNDFRLTRLNRWLEISDDNPDIEQDHIDLKFQDFNLSDLMNYLNPEKLIAKGALNGDVMVIDPFGDLGFLANLGISNLTVLEAPLGNLQLDAKALDTQNYEFELAINGGDVDLNLDGNYKSDSVAPSFQIDLDINQLNLKAIENLSRGEIQEASGYISGQFNVSGTTANPKYKGNLSFTDGVFNVKKLNALFKISDETISVDNLGIYLERFTIRDEKDNRFFIDGSILTKDFTNPEFDLRIAANEFSVLNSTRKDNDLFYGKAIFDVRANLTGNLNLPKLQMKLDLHPSTDVTYILAESDVQVEERDGVVLFVNKANPDDILTQPQKEESYIVKGLDVTALIAIKRDATFNVIINERTKDNLRISGEGDLNLNIDSNGRINLSGRYEVTAGHFELNLYNIVNRRFDIVEGSSITWSGELMDASLDIRAVYEVETSASALMAAQTSGMDPSDASKFRQRLPFLVYLNVGGEITQPNLSFNIDMPEDERGAIGGQVYSRIRQIDQQEDERNRQVFSLLVLDRFFPDAGSDGSGGGAMALARNNLNQALSDQLNTLSDRLLGKTGLELDFGLNSYTDYQGAAPQDRTQLDITAQKKLFDDRLILSVGSEVDIQGTDQTGEESTPVIGNVAIEYLITEDGRFRVKGFRKNQYENVIDGQIFVNGIALIFSKEFNKYKELFQKEVKEEKQRRSRKRDRNENKK